MGSVLHGSKEIKVGLGTNQLPHPPVTLEVELFDEPTQAETLSPNLVALSFLGGKKLMPDYSCLP